MRSLCIVVLLSSLFSLYGCDTSRDKPAKGIDVKVDTGGNDGRGRVDIDVNAGKEKGRKIDVVVNTK